MISQDSRSLKVLLVDDHHIVREGLRTIITRAGISTHNRYNATRTMSAITTVRTNATALSNRW
jgi:YesN/AraC family two-component response regulator